MAPISVVFRHFQVSPALFAGRSRACARQLTDKLKPIRTTTRRFIAGSSLLRAAKRTVLPDPQLRTCMDRPCSDKFCQWLHCWRQILRPQVGDRLLRRWIVGRVKGRCRRTGAASLLTSTVRCSVLIASPAGRERNRLVCGSGSQRRRSSGFIGADPEHCSATEICLPLASKRSKNEKSPNRDYLCPGARSKLGRWKIGGFDTLVLFEAPHPIAQRKGCLLVGWIGRGIEGAADVEWPAPTALTDRSQRSNCQRTAARFR